MAESAGVNIIVAVDIDRFDETVGALRVAGVVVDREMRDVGTVSGRVAGDRVPDVRGLDGVIAVEPSRSVQLPPPDHDVQ